MGKKVVNVGMLGLGTVASGVVNILKVNSEQVKYRAGTEIKIKKILVTDKQKKREVDVSPDILTTNPADILEDEEIDVVLELMGGVSEARQYIEEALRRKKFVITANKDLMASAGAEILSLARQQGRNVFYEASVGGGIPLIRPLKSSLGANKINRLMGIINGTTNYILTKMSMENMKFNEALAEAQEKGFAEQDPGNDLEGKDAAYKICILAGLAFNCRVKPDEVHIEGINGISARDIFYARELGFTLKLLAVGEELDKGIVLRVHPALIPSTHPLAAVLYENNALYVSGNAVGEVMFYGLGAGSMPTGSSVVADLIEAARCVSYGIEGEIFELFYNNINVVPMEELYSAFYLRLQAIDQPGVFASLSTAFGDEKVSLDMIIQKRSIEGQAEIVLVTHDVEEKFFNRALGRVQRFPFIKEINSVFRVIKE